MYRGERVAVVVPAYNEERHVRGVLETLPALVDRAYVVDDASTDDTWAEIRAAVRAAPAGRAVEASAAGDAASAGVSPPNPDAGGTGATDAGGPGATDTGGPGATDAGGPGATDAGGPGATDAGGPGATDGGRAGDRTDGTTGPLPGELPVRVPDDGADPVVVAVRHAENRGRGAAVKKGYRLALADGMDVVAVMDGDGQMAPDQLERIVHPVATGRADYAKGNRLDGPEYWRGMSGWRLFGNVLLTGLTRVSSGYWGLRDPQNGYTAISRETLAALPLEELYDDYGFLNDVLGALSVAGARVTDVPLPAVYGDEESGIRYGQFVPAVSTLLLANFLRRLYVDGTRRRRVWLPAAYGLAGAGWLGALAASVALALPAAGEAAPLALVATGGVATVLWLATTGGVATALAVALDRRRNAVLDAGDARVVDPG